MTPDGLAVRVVLMCHVPGSAGANGHTRHRNAVPSRCTRHAYRVEAGEENVTAWLTSSVPAARPSCCDASPLMGMSRLMPLWRRIWPVPPENGRIYNMFPAVV